MQWIDLLDRSQHLDPAYASERDSTVGDVVPGGVRNRGGEELKRRVVVPPRNV
jgi:hypothetical protein